MGINPIGFAHLAVPCRLERKIKQNKWPFPVFFDSRNPFLRLKQVSSRLRFHPQWSGDMPEMSLLNHRIRVDGRLFRCGGGTFFVKGFTYGPFQPGAEGIFFPSPEQVKKDFGDLRALNANVVRIYHPPPEWILDEAKEAGLFLLVDIPWNKHLYFLKDRKSRQDALGHPCRGPDLLGPPLGFCAERRQ